MNKKLIVLSLVLILTFSLASPVFAHSAPPCNDTDGDGSNDGEEDQDGDGLSNLE